MVAKLAIYMKLQTAFLNFNALMNYTNVPCAYRRSYTSPIVIRLKLSSALPAGKIYKLTLVSSSSNRLAVRRPQHQPPMKIRPRFDLFDARLVFNRRVYQLLHLRRYFPHLPIRQRHHHLQSRGGILNLPRVHLQADRHRHPRPIRRLLHLPFAHRISLHNGMLDQSNFTPLNASWHIKVRFLAPISATKALNTI